jgi:hypothetical protein
MLFLLLAGLVMGRELPTLKGPLLASQSDYGIYMLRNESATDANLYFVDDLEMTNKIHVIVGVTDCLCVAFGDIEKINQLDYLGVMHYVFSFGIYVSYNIPYRAKCGLTPLQVGQRSSLRWNGVGTNLPSLNWRPNPWWPIPLHKPSDDWIEGPVMWAGMRDFISHSYVTTNSKVVYDTDKSGGVLYVQGTVFMRPCLLWPWYIPWILDSYGVDAFTIHLTPPFTLTPYLNATDAALFYETISVLTEKGIITDKHMANLKDNNDNMANRARVFHFQAVFIPHRFVGEFMALLAGFKDTSLCSSVYVPFIFQLLWDKNSWHHLTGAANNNTIYASTQPLLNSCLGDTVEVMMENVNQDLVQELSYFAYGWCGWPSPINQIAYIIKDEMVYLTKTAKIYFMYHVYEFVFWTVIVLLILGIIWCMRLRIYDAYLKCKLKFPSMEGYRKFNMASSYVAHDIRPNPKHTSAQRDRQMDTFGRDDDSDENDRSINV